MRDIHDAGKSFSRKEKEQAEVRQSLTFCPHATATEFKEFSGNSLAFSKGIKPQNRIPFRIPATNNHIWNRKM
ncbi:MAG: hypothetical protein EOO88_28000 [Pedobacter sp.]|nr:MAG: hypothetical protein EOO88_28000 [Pedobacter sp.]